MLLWIVLLGLSVTVQTAYAGSCRCPVIPPPSLHHQYCGATYMIRARILSDLIVPDDTAAKPYYQVRVFRTFKAPDGISFRRRGVYNVYLDMKDWIDCDMIHELQTNQRYLLSGNMESGNLTLGGCNTFYAKYRLSSEYRTLVKNPPPCPAPVLKG